MCLALALALSACDTVPGGPGMPTVPGVAAKPGTAADTATAEGLSRAALGPVNAVRAPRRLAPLRVSAPLVRAAAAHARDLARHGRFSHVGGDGSAPGDRARRQGYRFCFVAENIARGQTDLAAVLRGWMGSPAHRRNLLDRGATEFGLARAPGDLWVMVLGRPGC